MNPTTIPVLLALAFACAAPALGFGGDSEALLATPGNRVLTPIPQGLNDDDDDDTAPRPAVFKAPTSISRSQLRELTEQTDHYYFSKHLGAGCAIGATVLMIGGMALMISESSTSDETAADGSTKSEATTVGYVGAGMYLAALPVGVLGGVEIVIAVVRGIKLRHYEREIGYQFSLVPVYDPRTRTSGALARVEF